MLGLKTCVVDDGTGVIDCAHRVQRAPKTPTKKDTKKTHSISNKPMARIGLSIKVIGKVQKAYGTRQVQVDELGELDCRLWLTDILESLRGVQVEK